MIAKILVATDFSELGSAAVAAALELAQAWDAKVDVLHIFSVLHLPDSGYSAAQMQQLEVHARADLARATEAVAEAGHLGDTVLGFGEPATRILRVAEERRADVIVLGSHGRSGLSRLMLGSTAEDVLRRANVPVLVIRQPHKARTRTIGVAVDLGPDSAFVIESAFELANSLDARVHILHAYKPVVIPNEYGRGSIPYESLHQHACDALRALAAPYARLPTMGNCVADLGDPTTVILELADALSVDLLVVGTHGRQGLTRLIEGSVAESVLRQAQVPVLIAKHREVAAEFV